MKNDLHRKPPLYRQLADELTADILSGRYPVRSILPGENEIAAMRGLSRHTAREAMKLLEQNGLIVRRQRVGSMVVTNNLPVHYNQQIQSINDLLQYGNASRLQIVRSQDFIANLEIANLLNIDPGKACLKVDGVRYQPNDNRPFAYTEFYFNIPSKAKREQLLDLNQAIRYLTAKLNTPNLRIIRQTLTAKNTDKTLAAILKVKRGAATLQSLRTYVDMRDHFIAVAYTWHAGDRFSYSTVLTKAQANDKVS